jgi:Nucleotide modification associated domain 3
MHLDPDFDHLTYGDDRGRRGSEIARLGRGDLLAFYAGLRSIVDRGLVYALIRMLTVDEIVAAVDVPSDRIRENAHTRRLNPSPTEFVVRGAEGSSGRLACYLPIGEWRAGAYRVRQDLLDEWGGLSVKDGFIQRSARPPRFVEPSRFREWLDRQEVTLLRRNN